MFNHHYPKSKLLVLLVFYLTSLFCSAQQKSTITFVNRKDTLKKISDTLPLIAEIHTGPRSGDDVLITGVNDSIVTCLKSIFISSDTALQYKAQKDFFVSANKVSKDKSLTHIEKEKQLRYLRARLFFKDTIRIRVSTISKIYFQKEPYKFHRGLMQICYWGTVICIAATLVELSETHGNTNYRENYVHGGLALLGICGATLFPMLYHHINANILHFSKWRIQKSMGMKK